MVTASIAHFSVPIADRTIGKTLYREIVNKHPALKKNIAYRRLFSYLALGPHRLDEDTQNILLSRRQLARMMEIHPKKMNGSAFLKIFKQDVLPGLVWSGYSAEGGKCRAILKTGIDEFLQAHLWEDEEKERIYFLEQKSYNRANEQERYKATKYMHQTLYAQMGNKDQRLIAGYLHNLPYTYFKRLVTSHYREAKQVIEALECTENDRTNLRQSLYALRDFPMPFYHLSGDNMRLYSDGGLPMVKKEIRKVLCQGLIELDLVSCQCAIAAGIWNIDSINIVLQRGGSYWDAILTYMQVPEKLRPLAKPILKEATYSLMYGKKASHVERYVTRGFKGYAGKNNRVYSQGAVSIPKARKFTSCPLCKVPSKSDTIIRKSKEHHATDDLEHSAKVNNYLSPHVDVTYCKN